MKLHKFIYSLIALSSLFPFISKADEWPSVPHVVTSGIADVEAIPDMVTLSIKVSALAKNAVDAKKQVDHRVDQYFDFLEKHQVDKKDIQAAHLITEPEYHHQKEGKSLLEGYRTVREIQVKLHQLNKLNALLDQALTLGLNEIQALQFGVAEPEIYHKKAQQKAIENAKQQAEILAQGFQSALGPVYSIRYHTNPYQPRPVLRMYNAEAGISPDTAFTYQQQTIHHSLY